MKTTQWKNKVTFTAAGAGLMLAAAISCKSYSPEGKTLSDDQAGNSVANYYDMTKLPGRYIGKTAKVIIDTGNTSSFTRKLNAYKSAEKTIDVEYYIFGDYNQEHDYTSAIARRTFLERAKKGVKVRLMVDDGTTKVWRDDFVALKNEAIKAGVGQNLRIAYYRPFQLPNNHPLKYAETLFLEVQKQLKGKKSISAETILQLLLHPTTSMVDFAKNDFDPIKSVQLALAAKRLISDAEAVEANGLSALSGTVLDIFGQTPSTGNYAGFVAKLFTAAIKRPVTEEQATDLLNLMKRTHHKLSVVDGHFVTGGGRNMWDISHLDFNHPLHELDHKHDYDADFFIDDPNVAAAVTPSLNDFWECAGGASCKANIPINEETGTRNSLLSFGKEDAKSKAERDRLSAIYQKRTVDDAATYEARLSEPLREEPVLKGVIETNNVEVSYAENKMWKLAKPLPNGATEEPSDILAAWANLINATPAGKTILLQNAYFVLPTETIVPVVKAINRGVKFIYITTGKEKNDTPILADLFRMQAEAIMNLFAKVGKKDVIEIYEAYDKQQSHTKISAIGDYLVVGSANADSRSAYLNTENVMVVGPGTATWNNQTYPSASEAYKAFVLSEVRDPAKASRFRKIDLASITAYLDSTKNAAAYKVLRDWFAGSVRVGIEVDKASNDYRDRKTTARCRDGKEGFNQVGCSMRNWIHEQLFIQL